MQRKVSVATIPYLILAEADFFYSVHLTEVNMSFNEVPLHAPNLIANSGALGNG